MWRRSILRTNGRTAKSISLGVVWEKLNIKDSRLLTHRYAYHHHIRADIEASLHNGIFLQSRTLRIRRRHGPITLKWLAGSEEGDFCCKPPDEHVHCKTTNNELVTKAESQACVHYQHAHFDGIDQVEHCLFRDDHDLGAINALPYVFGCEGLVQSWWVQIRSTAVCDDVETDYKGRIEQLDAVSSQSVKWTAGDVCQG